MPELANRLQHASRAAIDRLPLLRRAVKSRPVQHAVQTARGAGVVTQPLRFAALELGRSRTATHRLRASGLAFVLRHRTRDVNILNEIFGGTSGRLCYEPPDDVAATLDSEPRVRVLDLGANIGLFGLYALGRWPQANVHSFEPDPANLELLSKTIAINGLDERWSVTEAAVANQPGTMSFEAGLYSDSRLVAPGAPDAGPNEVGNTIDVQSVDLFAEDHDVTLLKMDIEGGEWAILTDSRLAGLKADAIVLEWHSRGCPEQNAHSAARRLLQTAGYTRLEDVEYGRDDGVLWAWRGGAGPT